MLGKTCYSECSQFSNEAERKYYGKDEDKIKCKQCIDYNCISCEEDYTFCDVCNKQYVAENGTCYHPYYVTLKEINCTNITVDRCNYTVWQDRNVLLDIKISIFANRKQECLDGGAVYIINSAVLCQDNMFINCSSTEGGGAIYIKNSADLLNNVTFNNVSFINNQASYGGAIYIYSSYDHNEVRIQNCTFIDNLLNDTSSCNYEQIDSKLKGGSAIFMRSKRINVSQCKFSSVVGTRGAFKIFNYYDESNEMILNDNNNENQEMIVFEGCEFNINEDEENSISIEGNMNKEIEITNCVFKGKPPKGSYYIEGKSNEENKNKIRINECQFDYETMNSMNIIHIDEDHNKLVPIKRSKTTSKHENIIYGTFIYSMIVLLIVILIYAINNYYINKKESKSEAEAEAEENEKNNEIEFNQNLNDNFET